MKVLKKISSFLNTILGYVTFIAFFVIMIFIVLNVVMRYLFAAPILGAYEIVEQMMLVGVFTSFAYAQQQGSHIRVTMLIGALPARISMILCTITGLLGTGILCVLIYATAKQTGVAIDHNYVSAQLKFTLVPFYVCEVVCSAVFAFAVLVNTLEYLIAIFNKDLAAELKAKF